MLAAPMRDSELRIEPAVEAHREPLRSACAQDEEIWQIYPIRLFGEDFDDNFDAFFDTPATLPFVMFDGDRLVGTSSYLSVNRENRSVEIGRTYLVPDMRGTGLNRRIKTLMLDRAFAEGFVRVEFRIDTRNARSMSAVLKLGAIHEGTLRRNRTTWTGYVRDTAIFSILADEWGELRR